MSAPSVPAPRPRRAPARRAGPILTPPCALLWALLAVPQALSQAQTQPRAQPLVGGPPPADEAPRPASPPPLPLPLPDLTDPNARAAESLNQPGIASDIPKSLRGSASKSGGPANDLNPSGRPEGPRQPDSDLGSVVGGRALYHGNYCGAGDRGAGLPPTDALDAACMRHDACYDAAGYRSCACDAALRGEAAAVSQRPDVPLQARRRALSVAEAADLMGCRAP